MRQLILEPTTQAQWQTLVHEAQYACDRELDETLESYLVFLLMRFTDKPQCMSRVMAQDYLSSQAASGGERVERLRDVGDHCLLFSGLFPQLAGAAWCGSATSSILASPPTGSSPACSTAAGRRSISICPRPSSS